jgi:two-component system sensor histidine kinase UhpB
MLNKNLMRIIAFVFCCLFANNVFSQSKTTDSLIALIPKTKQDTSQAALLKRIAIQFFYLSDYENAKIYAQLLLKFSTKIDNKKGMSDGYNLLGTILMKKDNYDSAYYYMSLAVKMKQQSKDTAGVISCFINLAYLFRIQGQYDSSLRFFQDALPLSEQLKNTELLGKVISGIAAIYYSQGSYAPALEYYLRALKLAESIDDKITVAGITGNIGLVYESMGQPKLALPYHFRALALKSQAGNKDGAAFSLENIGTVYEGMKQYDSAIYYYNRSLTLCNEIESNKLAASNLGHISHVFIVSERPDSALFYNSKEYSIQKEIGNREGMMFSLKNEGDIYLMLVKKDNTNVLKAIRALREALSIAEAIGRKSSRLLIYQSLAKSYAAMNDHRTAFEYQVKYSDLHDSLKNETFSNQIAEMQTKYETEKKQTEINLLNTEKRISTMELAKRQTLNYSLAAIVFLILISSVFIYRNVQKKREAEKQVAVLEKQNAIESMRGKIANDVHDDMGAGLTKMGLFSEQLLQSKTVSEKEKQLLKKISVQSKEVIDGMREIIWASNPANDNLKSMLGFMRQYIDRFFDGTDIRPVVNFPHNIGEVILHPEVRRNLFLILKESLNNAVKYSGSDKVDVDFSNENENFNLNIKDYGKGMDDKNKDDFSNGLRNMQMRAERIQSAFKMITSPGNGVQIVIEGKLY